MLGISRHFCITVVFTFLKQCTVAFADQKQSRLGFAQQSFKLATLHRNKMGASKFIQSPRRRLAPSELALSQRYSDAPSP